MRLTRAYFEGYMEARFGSPGNKKCPHIRVAAQNDWNAGYERGTVLKHFTEGTEPATERIKSEVKRLRKALGEKV